VGWCVCMLDWMILYLVVAYLGTLLLGYLQTRKPDTMPGTETSHEDLYATAALTALCVQALLTIVVWGGTAYFPLGALVLALTISSHHAVIHRNSKFEGENCSCACFQVKDVSNHETWVVCSLVAAVVSLAHF
jgi:hypothetical protein